MSQLTRTLLVAALLAASVGAPSLSGAQTPQKPPAAAAPGMKGNADHMAAMDGQMKTMQVMHEKMVNAKTPEERNALMPEHMKTMQGGMATMGMMGGTGMGAMGGMAGMGSMQGGKAMPGDMNQRQQMMEKRMEMMQSMMQMMLDRMPATPAK